MAHVDRATQHAESDGGAARARMCGRCPVVRLRTEEQFGQLEAILKKMQSNLSQPRRFIKLDLEYHVLLAEASNNKPLHDLLFMIRSQLSAAMLTFVTMPGRRSAGVQAPPCPVEGLALAMRRPQGPLCTIT